ncbi:MAG: hypothetical protein A2Y40_08740 [Candidatus Margulisbacteria bacterium GWF2_35_9]|nr:MAG: hypothetical protein A2Y40_08740 [Candidatus Margulisbacteria bacterium GWF2_35_9]
MKQKIISLDEIFKKYLAEVEGFLSTKTLVIADNENQQVRGPQDISYSQLLFTGTLEKAIVEMMPDSVGVIDFQGKILWVNPSATTNLEYTVEEIKTSPHGLISIIHPDDINLMLEQLGKQVSGDWNSYRIRFISKSGKTIHTMITPQAIGEGTVIKPILMKCFKSFSNTPDLISQFFKETIDSEYLEVIHPIEKTAELAEQLIPDKVERDAFLKLINHARLFRSTFGVIKVIDDLVAAEVSRDTNFQKYVDATGVDPETRAFNPIKTNALLKEALIHVNRPPRNLAVLILRITNKDEIIDKYKSSTVQQIMHEMQYLIKEVASERDKIGLNDQGDLVVISPAHEIENILKRFEKMSYDLTHHQFQLEGKSIPVDIKMGASIVSRSDEIKDVSILTERAEKALNMGGKSILNIYQ